MSEDNTDTATLYDQIVELLKLEPEDEESSDDYKARVVRHAGDMEDDDFEKLPDDVKEWLNAATEVVKKNRGARKKAALPALDGLEDDEVEEKPKKGRKAKAEKKAKEPKEPKEKTERDPEANRFFKIGELMVDNPTMSLEDLNAKASKLDREYSERSISRVYEAFRGIYGVLKKHDKLAV